MKVLKYVLGILLIIVLGFFAIGLISPEIEYECEVAVKKPLDEAWAVSQDENKMSDWLIGFQKIEPISGTPGTVGAVSDIYFVNEGKEMVIRETINDIVEDESISMTFESDFMDMNYTLNMSQEGEQTKIRSFTIAKGNGAFSKSLMALMAGSVKAQEEYNLSNLKKVIEENKTVYN